MPMNKASGARKARSKRGGGRRPFYAAVDLGTNNCRLLIAGPDGEHFRVVDSYSQIVRLGEGLASTGRLGEASMARAFDALSTIRKKLKQYGVGHVRCVATEACRKAENGAEFIQAVQARTGLSFKIINAHEEARLAAIGCHDLLEPDARLVMVLDIGGGSTEISFVDLAALEDRSLKGLVRSVPIKAWRSFPLGVVTLSESFDGPDEQKYAAMLKRAEALFADWTAGRRMADEIAQSGAYIIGTSGTVTCLAGVHLELERYQRRLVDGLWMDADQIRTVISQLHEAGRAGRIALPTIGHERADLMMSGCAILEAAWKAWPATRLRVADRGLREGLLLSMMHAPPKRRRGPKPSSHTAAPLEGSDP